MGRAAAIMSDVFKFILTSLASSLLTLYAVLSMLVYVRPESIVGRIRHECPRANQAQVQSGNHEVSHSNPHAATCGRYILFTSQRSGSTWTCQVLNSQLGLTCGMDYIRNFQKER